MKKLIIGVVACAGAAGALVGLAQPAVAGRTDMPLNVTFAANPVPVTGSTGITVSSPAGTWEPGKSILIGECTSDPVAIADGALGACGVIRLSTVAGADGSLGPVNLTLKPAGGKVGTSPLSTCPPTVAQQEAGVVCAVVAADALDTTANRGAVAIPFQGLVPPTTTIPGETTTTTPTTVAVTTTAAPTSGTVNVSFSPNPIVSTGTATVTATAGTFAPGTPLIVGYCVNDPALTLTNGCDVAGAKGVTGDVVAGDDGSLAAVTIPVKTGKIGSDAAAVCPPTKAGVTCVVAVAPLADLGAADPRANAKLVNVPFAGTTGGGQATSTTRATSSTLPRTGASDSTGTMALAGLGLLALGGGLVLVGRRRSVTV